MNLSLKAISVAALSSLLLIATSAAAAQIYQWKDSQGVVHFTDNPANVPAKYRSKSARDLKPLESVKSTDSVDKAKAPVRLSGKKLWQQRCVSCHHLGQGFVGDKPGLGELGINRTSKFRTQAKDVLRRLKSATSGRRSDMDKIDISDEELLVIAEYVIDTQWKK